MVRAEDGTGQPCSGVALEYGDDEDADFGDDDNMNTSPAAGGFRDVVTDSNGLATFTRGPRPEDADINWRVWADLPGGSDDHVWQAGEANLLGDYEVYNPTLTTLDCDADDDSTPGNQTGTNHTVTCTGLDENGRAWDFSLNGDVHIDAEWLSGPRDAAGPNDGNATPADENNAMHCGLDPACGLTTDQWSSATPGVDLICYWIDGNGEGAGEDTDSNGATPDDGSQCGEAFNAPENDNQTDVVRKTWSDPAVTTVNVTPETDTNNTGTNHTFTVTVTDQFGNAVVDGTNIDFEITAGPNMQSTPAVRDFECNTTGGQCTVNYNGLVSGTDTVCGWYDSDGDNVFGAGVADGGDCNEGLGDFEDDRTDVVQKTWAAAPAGLDCDPDVDFNQTGTTHQITCTLTDAGGNPINGGNVDIEATGANDPDGADTPTAPDYTCTTNASGVCSFTHILPTNNTGTTTYRAWHDTDNNNNTDNSDTTEGQCAVVNEDGTGCTPAVSGGTAEPDKTDVMTKTWHNQAFALEVTPTNDTAAVGVCNAYTVTVKDNLGNPVPGVWVDAFQTHANFGTANPTPTVGWCQPPAGSGPNIDGGPYEIFNQSMTNDGDPNDENDEDGQVAMETNTLTNAAGQVTIGISSTGTGNVTLNFWCEQEFNGTLCPNGGNVDIKDNGEPQVQAFKTWTAGGVDTIESVDAEPEDDDNNEGQVHTFTATLRNGPNNTGDPVAGITPLFDVTAGPNATNIGPTACTASNSSGVSTCSYTDNTPNPSAPGQDVIEVWVNQAAGSGGGTPGPDGPPEPGGTGAAGEPRDTIRKDWHAAPATACLDAEPEDATNPTTAEHTITATLTDARGTNTADDTCAGAALADFQVTATITDDTPNAYIASVNGVATTGQPNSATGLTNASGQLLVTIKLVDTAASQVGQNGNIVDFVVTGSADSDAAVATLTDNLDDKVHKGWANAGAGTILDVTPETATNPLGTTHTLTAKVTDGLGAAVAGANVDFVGYGGGPNNNQFRECDTGADGTCTVTYTSAAAGDDFFRAHIDTNGDDVTPGESDATEGNATVAGVNEANVPGGTAEPDNTDAVHKRWAADVAAADVELDMIPGGDNVGDVAAGDHTNPPTKNTAVCNANLGDLTDNDGAGNDDWDPTNTGEVNTVELVCVTAKNAANQVLFGRTVTLTSAGVGTITDNDGPPPSVASQTATIGTDGYAYFYIYSSAQGNQNLTATVDSATDTGTKTYTVSTAEARVIDCEPETAENAPGEDHEIVCTVTDGLGNPVPGVAVAWSKVDSDGATSSFQFQQAVTDANGQARASINSPTTGTVQVTGSISAATTECEEAAGGPGANDVGKTAGVCTDTVEKDYVTPEPECNDDVDNDGDGNIDFDGGGAGEPDTGCESATDDSEFEPGSIEDPHEREIKFTKFKHIAQDGPSNKKDLLVKGTVETLDGTNRCSKSVPVKLQIFKSGEYLTIKSDTTAKNDPNGDGKYVWKMLIRADEAGKYRAIAPQVEKQDPNNSQILHICEKDAAKKRHEH